MKAGKEGSFRRPGGDGGVKGVSRQQRVAPTLFPVRAITKDGV